MNPNNHIPIITLDGPSGTGKGTLCHLLANHLGWHLLDSGLLYRVLAYAAEKKGIDFANVVSLVTLANTLDLHFKATEERNKVILDNRDVLDFINTERCGQDASLIAAIPEVRETLLAKQRAFAQLPGLVTDGRDMGTVVFPSADLKIYLYASPEERASRRYFQLKEKGINVSLAEVLEKLTKRDSRDMARSYAPLRPAEDAILIDTTSLSIEQVMDKILELVQKVILIT